MSPRAESPVIVIGMHRSGTTLLARLLEDLGIAMGMWQAKETSEAMFFRRRNELMFRLAHATWDNPDALVLALEDPRLRRAFGKVAAHDLGSIRTLRFVPPEVMRAFVPGGNQVWGFKDPRNCITLPVWLDVFPNARVIHIVRHGSAVASSLVRRGEQQLEKNFVHSLVALDSTLSLDLWADYVLLAHKNCATVARDRYLEVRYESLINSPREEVKRLAEFVGTAAGDQRLEKVASRVDGTRRATTLDVKVSQRAKRAFALFDY